LPFFGHSWQTLDPVIVINNAAIPAGGRALTVIGGNVYRGGLIPPIPANIYLAFCPTFTADAELFIGTPSGQVDWVMKIHLVSRPAVWLFSQRFGQDNSVKYI
jgi:hypothetical protein